MEIRTVKGVMDRELDDVIDRNRADPNYVSHRVIERYGGVNDIEFTFRRHEAN